MKKQLLIVSTAIHLFFGCSLYAQQQLLQQSLVPDEKRGECGTKAPDENWENWFQLRIAEFKLQQLTGRDANQIVTIPIVVHVLHNSKAVGTAANIAAAQIEAQIEFLNDCMAGKAS